MRNPAVIVALLAAGCATRSLDLAPSAGNLAWSPAVDAAGAIVPRRASSPPSGAGYVLPPNPAGAVMPAPPAIDASRTYALADLIDLAESTNPETRIAWNDARNAALAVGVARSAYLPRLSATAIGGIQTSTGRATALGRGIDSGDTLSGSVAAVSLQWLLFDFGKRAAVVDAAGQGSVVANIAFTAAHQRLIHAVSLAFYAYSAARDRAATAALSLDDARAVAAAADSRRAHGVGTVIEVAQARQFAAQAELARVEAAGRASDAYVALLAAMGIPPLTPIRIADTTRTPLPADLDGSIDAVLRDALARRPDVLAAIAAEAATKANIRAAKADFRPKVFVSGSGSYSSGSLDLTALPGIGDEPATTNLSSHRFGATLIGGVTIPLYDGGIRDAALARARDQADSAAQTVIRTKTSAAQEVIVANTRLRTSLAVIAATNALLSASQTTYDAAFAAFRNAVGSSTDVLAAERQLLDARIAVTEARSAAFTAAATLALACGRVEISPQ